MDTFINILKAIIFGGACTIVSMVLGFNAIAAICAMLTLLVIIFVLWISAFESLDLSIPCRVFLSSLILLIPSVAIQEIFELEFSLSYVVTAITGISFIVFLAYKFFFD